MSDGQSVYFWGSIPVRIISELVVRWRISCEYGQKPIREAMQDHDAVWITLERITAADIPDNPRCQFIACPCTGLDHIDLEACQAAGIEVISLQGESRFLQGVRATAEHTMALMLAILRKLPWGYQDVLKGNWRRDRYCGSELHGKVVGIIGLGRVGYQVSQLLRAFGCTVLSVDKNGQGLDVLLQASDIISMHVPYGPETHHWFDAEKLKQVKRGAILVNTSRGGVIDEPAVAAELLSGRLAGVAVDVLEGEPDIADSPLAGLARTGFPVLITPHLGGNTHESREKTELFIATKLAKAMHNRPPDEDGFDTPGDMPEDEEVSPLLRS